MLIGCSLWNTAQGTRVGGVVVETEAYVGPEDKASHAFGGRRTARVEAMYAQPGTAYVYFTYGTHFCMNVSCFAAGHPAAVLVRAIEPRVGLEVMSHLRGTNDPMKLCKGPGNLCRALGIHSAQNGINLCLDDSFCFTSLKRVHAGDLAKPLRIATTARIGIGDRGIWTRRRLRFFLNGSPFVSRLPSQRGTNKPSGNNPNS